MPRKVKSRRHHYDRENLVKAYSKVLDKNISVRRVAKMFDVHVMTLRDRDRVTGKIAIETTKPGPDSIFAREDELTLVEHLEAMAELEYG